MNSKIALYVALSVVSSIVIGGTLPGSVRASDSSQVQVAEVGKRSPEFALPDAAGKIHALADYKGKFVVLEWINFGCPFVRKHYDSHNMQNLQEAYTSKGVVWLSICSSAKGKQGNLSGEELKTKLSQYGWKGTAYLIDLDGVVGKRFGAKATPTMYVMSKDHELVYAGAIDDKPTADPEDVPKAHNYVKAALDEAMGGKKIATASSKAYGCSVKYSD